MQSLTPIDEERSTDDESFVGHDEQSDRWSERQDASRLTDASALPPPVPLYTPFPTLAVSNFLTDDDGASLIEEDDGDELPDEGIAVETLPSAAASSSSTLRLYPTRSRSSSISASTTTHSTSHLARFISRDSVSEHLTTQAGEKIFPLAEFCKLIEQHASLERAKILSVECYKEPIQLGVVHRTLIFHLRREGRTDVWMRVDRRRSRDVPFRVFAIRGGRTEANDVALLAGSKETLLDRRPARLENRIEFRTPPHLGVFRFCLQIICEELLEYHLWPQNCWFMCSLLQEHLFDVGEGSFRYGKHVYQHLAPGVRAKVGNRVYHLLPEPPSVLEMLAQLPSSKHYNQFVIDLRTLIGGHDLRSTAKLSAEQVGRITRAIHVLHRSISSYQTQTDPSSNVAATASHLLVHALSLERRSSKDSTPLNDSRSRIPKSYKKYLLSPQTLELVRFYLLDMQREQYRANPDRHWEEFAFYLGRTARNTGDADAMSSRACVREARDLLLRHSRGSKPWFNSQVLEGHAGGVGCVTFSPDGKQIASASDDRTIRRWDALTGEKIGEPMLGHESTVFALAFSPDGTQIISGSSDNTLRRWGASSGEPIGGPMRGHTGTVLSIAYSLDGTVGVSGSSDRTIPRWDASTGETVGEPLKGHKDFVRSVAFSPDSKRIVSGSYDQTIRLWDASTGEAIGEPWKGHTGEVSSVAFSPDGKFVVSGSWDKTMRCWNALTGESIGLTMRRHTSAVLCVACSPDGKQIASASSDHTIRLWDATTGKQIGEPLEGHTGPVLSVAFSPDGRQIVSGSRDDTVRIWDSLENLDRWIESG